VDEARLIESALAGDSGAERRLYDAHVGRVYRLAHRMTGQADLAEEFTQEAFVRAFERLGSFEGRSRLSTWLHSIAVTVVLNGMRRVRRNRERERAVDESSHLEALGGSTRETDHNLRLALHRALDELNDDMRMVVVMHDLEGFTHEEIAAAMNVETGTSKARLSRARAKLREILHGLDPRPAKTRPAPNGPGDPAQEGSA
jgi:RNA polymerase sigma-70 factor (ECF subfamily)